MKVVQHLLYIFAVLQIGCLCSNIPGKLQSYSFLHCVHTNDMSMINEALQTCPGLQIIFSRCKGTCLFGTVIIFIYFFSTKMNWTNFLRHFLKWVHISSIKNGFLICYKKSEVEIRLICVEYHICHATCFLCVSCCDRKWKPQKGCEWPRRVWRWPTRSLRQSWKRPSKNCWQLYPDPSLKEQTARPGRLQWWQGRQIELVFIMSVCRSSRLQNVRSVSQWLFHICAQNVREQNEGAGEGSVPEDLEGVWAQTTAEGRERAGGEISDKLPAAWRSGTGWITT